MPGITLYRPSLRALGAIGVLTAWVGSLAWLGIRELGQNEGATITSQASLRLGPNAAWFALYAGDTQVGSAGITLDTLSPGYRILETVSMEIPGDSGLVRATRRTETLLAGTLELDSIYSRSSRLGRPATVWTLTQSGDTLVASYRAGPASVRGMARFDVPFAPASAFSYRLALSGGLSPGKTRRPMLVEGWPPAGRPTGVSVGADSTFRFADSSVADGTTGRQVAAHFDEVKAFPVIFDGPTGPERVWIDRFGTIVEIETVFGVRWRRDDFELAVQEFLRQLPQTTARIRGALPALTALGSGTGADTGVGERRFRVEHRDGRPVDRALLTLLGGGRQAVQGDTILVRSESFATQAGGFDTLTRDPMIQWEAREIFLLSSGFRRQGPTRDALKALADTLRRMVRLDTSTTAAIDALGALKMGRAQPDGFVRLYVAVLQAAGVPARMVIGVSPSGSQLRTHAWAEVRESRGTGWLAVDPVRGQVPASTSLVRLAYGGSSHPEELLASLADVKFIVLGPSEILP